MELRGSGKLHESGQPARTISFTLREEGLELGDGDSGRLFPWSDVRLRRGGFQNRMWLLLLGPDAGQATLYVQEPADPLAFQARLLEHPWGVALYVEQQEAEASVKPGPGLALKLGAIAALILLAAALWKGPQMLASLLVWQVPDSWEQSLGRSSASEILAQHQGACTSPAMNDLVGEIATRLAQALPGKRPAFRVFVLDSDEINAFALPGGYLFVCRGLIEKAERPEEIAGVLAHEFQHVLLRHGLRNVLYQAGLGVMLRVLLGGSGAEDWMVQGVAGLGSLAFSRSQEAEADEHGLELMLRAGFQPRGMVSFFERLSKEDSIVPAFLSTHPGSRERALLLEARIAELPTEAHRPLRSVWPLPESECRPAPLSNPDLRPVVGTAPGDES